MARPRRRQLDPLVLILGSIFVIVAVITGVVAFKVVGDTVRSWTITPLEGMAEPTLPAMVDLKGTPIPGTDIVLQPASAGPEPVKWDGTSRVTLLVVGLDARDLEAKAEASRSDTMMLLTLDPLSKTAGMLSVPRDMWVNVPPPVNKYAKINQAYYFGELLKLPGGGPAMAVKTVQSFLGVPIQFYAQIDFQAFEKFIDTIGGINVTVEQEMDIDPLGRTADGKSNTIHLVPGRVHLDGPAALAFARARHITGDDFSRAKNQQEVIMGIRQKILRLNMLPTLVAKAPEIYQELSSGIHTNLTLDQVIKLSMFAINIQLDQIKKGVLGPNEADFAKSADGLDILIPKPDKIRIVRDEVFTTGGPAGPAATNKDEAALMKSENARVTLRNGSSTAGLANQTSDYFKQNGLNIVEVANADKAYNETTITIYNGKPYTAAYLAKVMNVPTSRITTTYTPDAKTDIVVLIGQDWARKNPMK